MFELGAAPLWGVRPQAIGSITLTGGQVWVTSSAPAVAVLSAGEFDFEMGEGGRLEMTGFKHPPAVIRKFDLPLTTQIETSAREHCEQQIACSSCAMS